MVEVGLGEVGVAGILEEAAQKLDNGLKFFHGHHHPVAPRAGNYIYRLEEERHLRFLTCMVKTIVAEVSLTAQASSDRREQYTITVRVNDGGVLRAMKTLAQHLEATGAEVRIVY